MATNEEVKRIARIIADVAEPRFYTEWRVMKAYRVIVDEPLGVAVGFVPTPISINGVNYPDSISFDEYDVVGDDGGNAVFTSDSGDLVIRGNWNGVVPPVAPPGFSYPEPSDLLIWRSPEEWTEYIRDFYGVSEDFDIMLNSVLKVI